MKKPTVINCDDIRPGPAAGTKEPGCIRAPQEGSGLIISQKHTGQETM